MRELHTVQSEYPCELIMNSIQEIENYRQLM